MGSMTSLRKHQSASVPAVCSQGLSAEAVGARLGDVSEEGNSSRFRVIVGLKM